MSFRRQRGFSLVEVLVASFILFVTIATMTLVYRGALLSSSKAEESLSVSATVLPIRQIISDGFRNGNFSELGKGVGTYGTVDYEWQARLSHIGLPSAVVQEDSGLVSQLRYYLWDIKLTIKTAKDVREFQFRELSR